MASAVSLCKGITTVMLYKGLGLVVYELNHTMYINSTVVYARFYWMFWP